ncbi:MAG: hypothetical protein JWM86_1930 [Thermoleophilia bacterium]|nr:hypothetical protein [Thermoleophilia bacterium]
MSDDDDASGFDYRGNYKAAVDEAIKGGIGVYADFDQARQMESFRVLSGDRSRLLTFARREGLTTGHVETLQTLRSPKPLYQMVAQGDEDTRKVRAYLDRLH